MRRSFALRCSRSVLSLATLLAFAGTAFAQIELHRVQGRAAGDQLGAAVAAVRGPAGKGYVIAGAPNGSYPLSTSNGTVIGIALVNGQWINPYGLPIPGQNAGDHFGAALAQVGNLNANGWEDVLVGAPDATVNTAAKTGLAMPLDGQFATTILPPPGYLPGLGGGGRAGAVVGLAGDVDFDGTPELIVGAPNALRGGCASPCPQGTYYRGQALVYGGGASPLFTISGAVSSAYCYCYWTSLPSAVATLGDIDNPANGDEVLVSSQNDNYRYVECFSYNVTNQVPVSRWKVTGPASFGRALAVLDDVDGDGVRDFAVGIPASSQVELRSGATGDLLFNSMANTEQNTLNGTSIGGGFGSVLANAGDVDRDGVADLLVGAPTASPDAAIGAAGQVFVFSGKRGDPKVMQVHYFDPIYVLHGAAAGDGFGSAVTGVPDLDGDGRAEVAVGSPGAFAGAGLVQIFTLNDTTADVARYGAACRSAGGDVTPTIGTPLGPPLVGQPWSVSVGNTYGNNATTLFLSTAPASTVLCAPLPTLCGCTLLVSPAGLLPNLTVSLHSLKPAAAVGSGLGWIDFAIPNLTTLQGLSFYTQSYTIDPGGNPLVAGMSPGLKATIR